MANDYLFKSGNVKEIVGEWEVELPRIPRAVLDDLLDIDAAKDPDWSLESTLVGKTWFTCMAALVGISALSTSSAMSLNATAEKFRSALNGFWGDYAESGYRGELLAPACRALASAAQTFDVQQRLMKDALSTNDAEAFENAVHPIRELQIGLAFSAAAVIEGAASGDPPGVALGKIEPTPWESGITSGGTRAVDPNSGGSRPPAMPPLPPVPPPKVAGGSGSGKVEGTDPNSGDGMTDPKKPVDRTTSLDPASPGDPASGGDPGEKAGGEILGGEP